MSSQRAPIDRNLHFEPRVVLGRQSQETEVMLVTDEAVRKAKQRHVGSCNTVEGQRARAFGILESCGILAEGKAVGWFLVANLLRFPPALREASIEAAQQSSLQRWAVHGVTQYCVCDGSRKSS